MHVNVDTLLVDKMVNEVKSAGVFDQFRKDSMADVDTKPAYQNLRQRVESTVTKFLGDQTWRQDLNKNQLREKLRKHITEAGFLDTGVERIVDQVVNPKISTVFQPKIEDIAYKYLGIEKPHSSPPRSQSCNGSLDIKTDFFPTDLEAVSPDSDKTNPKSECKEEVLNESTQDKNEEFESPPFEPIEGCAVSPIKKEDSNHSQLSGISGLTSQDSVSSEKQSTPKFTVSADTQPESELSEVSSNSRLSIVTNDESSSKPTVNEPDVGISEEAQMPKFSDSYSSGESKIVHNLHFDIKREDIKFEGTDRNADKHLYESDYSNENNSKTEIPIMTSEISKENYGESEFQGFPAMEIKTELNVKVEEALGDSPSTKVSFRLEEKNEYTPVDMSFSESESSQSVSSFELRRSENAVKIRTNGKENGNVRPPSPQSYFIPKPPSPPNNNSYSRPPSPPECYTPPNPHTYHKYPLPIKDESLPPRPPSPTKEYLPPRPPSPTQEYLPPRPPSPAAETVPPPPPPPPQETTDNRPPSPVGQHPISRPLTPIYGPATPPPLPPKEDSNPKPPSPLNVKITSCFTDSETARHAMERKASSTPPLQKSKDTSFSESETSQSTNSSESKPAKENVSSVKTDGSKVFDIQPLKPPSTPPLPSKSSSRNESRGNSSTHYHHKSKSSREKSRNSNGSHSHRSSSSSSRHHSSPSSSSRFDEKKHSSSSSRHKSSKSDKDKTRRDKKKDDHNSERHKERRRKSTDSNDGDNHRQSSRHSSHHGDEKSGTLKETTTNSNSSGMSANTNSNSTNSCNDASQKESTSGRSHKNKSSSCEESLKYFTIDRTEKQVVDTLLGKLKAAINREKAPVYLLDCEQDMRKIFESISPKIIEVGTIDDGPFNGGFEKKGPIIIAMDSEIKQTDSLEVTIMAHDQHISIDKAALKNNFPRANPRKRTANDSYTVSYQMFTGKDSEKELLIDCLEYNKSAKIFRPTGGHIEVSPTSSELSLSSKENEFIGKAKKLPSPNSRNGKHIKAEGIVRIEKPTNNGLKTSSQRYSSEDLYKPRPLSQRPRRREMIMEPEVI